MPKGSRKKPRENRRANQLLWSGAFLFAVILGYVAYIYFGVKPEPLRDVFQLLEGQGYTQNISLSGHFRPGNIVQIAEAGSEGKERELLTPLVVAWAQNCFPGREAQISEFSLPQLEGSSSGSLSIGSELLTKRLARLRIESTAVANYNLKFNNVRILAFAKGDLSGSFSEECVRKLRELIESGDKVEWFRIVMEAVVADEMLMEINWKGDATADVKQFVTEKTGKALSQPPALQLGAEAQSKPDVRVAVDDAKKTVLSAKGLVIIAYRARPIQAKTVTSP